MYCNFPYTYMLKSEQIFPFISKIQEIISAVPVKNKIFSLVDALTYDIQHSVQALFHTRGAIIIL